MPSFNYRTCYWLFFNGGKRFYRQILNSKRSISASTTDVTIELEENNRRREERPISRDTNNIVLEDYNPETEGGTCTRVTNNTEDVAASTYTEDIVKMMQEMMADGINSIQQQITRVDEKLDKLDGKLTRKMNEMENKFDTKLKKLLES